MAKRFGSHFNQPADWSTNLMSLLNVGTEYVASPMSSESDVDDEEADEEEEEAEVVEEEEEEEEEVEEEEEEEKERLRLLLRSFAIQAGAAFR